MQLTHIKAYQLAAPGEINQAMGIIHEVARWWRVTVDDLLSRARNVHVSAARHYAMWLVRHLLDLSTVAIGALFDRDHSTVVHACKLIDRRMAASDQVRLMVNEFLDRHRQQGIDEVLSLPTAE